MGQIVQRGYHVQGHGQPASQPAVTRRGDMALASRALQTNEQRPNHFPSSQASGCTLTSLCVPASNPLSNKIKEKIVYIILCLFEEALSSLD
jgi:hypothetical protein